MKNAITIFVGLLVSTVLTVSVSSSAMAQGSAIAQAKNDCEVGEGADGYLHVSGDNVAGNLDREVKAVNLKRKAAYTDLAKENKVAVEVAAALTAEKLVAKASSGQCVLDAEGNWSEVP